jgi:hypothetical protein
MKTVNAKQPPFRHEFYAVVLRLSGNNKEVNGQFWTPIYFLIPPYQIITWDIKLDWVGIVHYLQPRIFIAQSNMANK